MTVTVMKNTCMNYKTILSLIIMATMLMSMKSSSDNFDFPKAWKEVEQLSQDNLPKSVIAKVNEIAKAAEDEDNRPQQIKATSYIASYKLRTEEEGLDQAIVYLSDKITESKSDEVEAIYRVILADFYKQYLRRNQEDPQPDLKMSLADFKDKRFGGNSKIGAGLSRLPTFKQATSTGDSNG